MVWAMTSLLRERTHMRRHCNLRPVVRLRRLLLRFLVGGCTGRRLRAVGGDFSVITGEGVEECRLSGPQEVRGQRAD